MAVAYAAREGASLATLGGGTLTITKPSGTVEGDLLVVYIICSANTTINPVESGWTTDVSAAGVRGYHRVAGASEPASYGFTRALQTNNILGAMVRITGAHATTPIDTLGAQAGGTGTTVVLPSITVTNGFYLFQMASVISNSTFTPPSEPTEDYDYQPATQAFATAGGHETVAAGATGTRTWTATNSGVRSGVMWAIVAGTQTITPPGIASTAAFGSATVLRGAVTITPGGIASTTAFGSPTLTTGPVTVAPAGIASSAALGVPAVLADQLIVATGIASTAVLGSPTVLRGAVTLAPAGIGSTTTFGSATIVATIAVRGTAYNHETGAVIAGATVKLFRDGDDVKIGTTTSGVDGTYSFTRDTGDPDTYWVLVRGDGVQGVSEEGNAPS